MVHQILPETRILPGNEAAGTGGAGEHPGRGRNAKGQPGSTAQNRQSHGT